MKGHNMKTDNLQAFEKSLNNTAGYLGIFHEIGYIGDSLSSGEFVFDRDGKKGHWDSYTYSWGKVIERVSGIKCTNFSSGGLRARDVYTQADTYRASWTDVNHLFEISNVKPCYFIALGLNDINHINRHGEESDYTLGIGDVKRDVDLNDYTKNGNSVAGWYAKIIQRLQSLSPDSKFFLVGIPNDHCFPNIEQVNAVIKEIAETLKNCYFLDLYNEAPDYDEAFYDRFFESDHMNAMGYIFTAKLIQTLADRVIWEHYQDFKTVQFIGTNLKRLEE